jgi:hypothetical protein
MLTVKLKGDCVEDGGAEREVEFYDDFDILADDGRSLYGLRLWPDGTLEIEATLSTARHGGKLLDGKLVVRPMDSGRVRISRDEYREE